MNSISLFTGAGGLDLGCEAAGFMTAAAVENSETATATLLATASITFRCSSQTPSSLTFSTLTLMNSSGGQVSNGERPRCYTGTALHTIFEERLLARVQRAGDDPRRLLDNYVDVLAEAQPMTFLMEKEPCTGSPTATRIVRYSNDSSIGCAMRDMHSITRFCSRPRLRSASAPTAFDLRWRPQGPT